MPCHADESQHLTVDKQRHTPNNVIPNLIRNLSISIDSRCGATDTGRTQRDEILKHLKDTSSHKISKILNRVQDDGNFGSFCTSWRRYAAFTLAEVLIVITIIGVVAVMTLPTLTKNIRNKEFVTAAKRVNSMISDSFAMIEANSEMRSAEDAEDFVENYLRQYLKINKICGYENHTACGFADTIYNTSDTGMALPTTMEDLSNGMLSYEDSSGNQYAPATLDDIDRRGYSFLTINGYSMMVFYNPNCKTDNTSSNHYIQDRVCVNIIWDTNGKGDPNTASYDVGFTTILYPRYSRTVTPTPYTSNAGSATFGNTDALCQSTAGTDYRVPDRDELGAMFFNANLLGITSGYFWSSSPISSELAWRQHFISGYRVRGSRSTSGRVRCVRR